jgi:hypothetical protein
MNSPNDEQRYWEEARNSYIKVWIKGLRAILGWSESHTLGWAEKWNDALDEQAGIFYHSPPEEWMAFEIVPERLKRALRDKPAGGKFYRMKELVAEAIRKSAPPKDVDAYDDQDWAEARRRVEAVLREHGEVINEYRGTIPGPE